MDQKRMKLIFLFNVFSNLAPLQGALITGQAGKPVEIDCKSKHGGTIVWLRTVDKAMEFLGSYTNGIERAPPNTPGIFSTSKMNKNILIIKAFTPDRDSGSYGCAELSGNKLKFGEVSRLQSAPLADIPVVKSVTTSPGRPATKANTSPTLCTCNVKTDQAQGIWSCSPIIMASLAGGCGVIILLLIVAIIYCNRIRTRRCPHHYKRKKQRRKTGDEHAGEN